MPPQPPVVFTAEEAQAMDRWLERERGFTLEGLMGTAGARLAAAARTLAGETGCQRLVFLVGPGNNGGDARVAEGILADGWDTSLWAPLDGDAPPALDDRTLVLDGLFGVGLCRPIEGQARAAVQHLAAAGCPVLAVDIPSGLCATTGEIVGADAGGVAVRADATLTFVGPKRGFFHGAGPACVGHWAAVDIGFPVEEARAWVLRRREAARA